MAEKVDGMKVGVADSL